MTTPTRAELDAALEWYARAPAGGHMEALLRAARAYREGLPAPPNIVWTVSCGTCRVNFDTIDKAAAALAVQLKTGGYVCGEIERREMPA